MNRALFLDRDGVIHVDKRYLHKIEEVEFIPGIFELCRHYKQRGYMVLVVTNQSGIARKLYTEKDFDTLMSWIRSKFAERGVAIDQVYHCSHHPDFTGRCNCRKPHPGLFLRAGSEHRIDMPKSLSVGDKLSDACAASRAGVGENWILRNSLYPYDEEYGFPAVDSLYDLVGAGCP